VSTGSFGAEGRSLIRRWGVTAAPDLLAPASPMAARAFFRPKLPGQGFHE
jgi:hypothetical protein